MKLSDLYNVGAETERAALSAATRIAPWLGPIPTAWLVADRTARNLGFPSWVAGVAGVTLELLGIASSVTALELRSYQKGKRKSDPDAPVRIGYTLIAVYFMAALGLTVVLDLLAQPFKVSLLAPAVFPFLSLVSVILLGVRRDHEERVAPIEDEYRQREERKRQEKERKRQDRERERKEKERLRNLAERSRKVLATLGNEVATLRQLVRNPGATQQQMGESLGVSRTTVANHLEKLEQAGAIRPQGDGYEFLIDVSMLPSGDGDDGAVARREKNGSAFTYKV